MWQLQLVEIALLGVVAYACVKVSTQLARHSGDVEDRLMKLIEHTKPDE